MPPTKYWLSWDIIQAHLIFTSSSCTNQLCHIAPRLNLLGATRITTAETALASATARSRGLRPAPAADPASSAARTSFAMDGRSARDGSDEGAGCARRDTCRRARCLSKAGGHLYICPEGIVPDATGGCLPDRRAPVWAAAASTTACPAAAASARRDSGGRQPD